MQHEGCQPARALATFRVSILQDMKDVSLALLHANGTKQAADRINQTALTANDFAQVTGMDGHFKSGDSGTLGDTDYNLLRMIDKGPNDALHQLFHKDPRSRVQSQCYTDRGGDTISRLLHSDSGKDLNPER